MKSWRDAAQHAIRLAKIVAVANGLEGDDIEKYVRKHGYPFGQREMHPYKIWCSEMKQQFPKAGRAPSVDLTDHPFLVLPKPAKGA